MPDKVQNASFFQNGGKKHKRDSKPFSKRRPAFQPAFQNAGYARKCRPAFQNAVFENAMPAGSKRAGRHFFAGENAGYAIFDGEYLKKASANSNNQPTIRKSIVRSVD
jgi:hypothetical protein